ncbi:MAG: DUF3667 domain-containing protein, partial [Bacteroidota bacterium]
MQCRNCKYELSETHNFCPNCGAKIIKNRLTLKNIWQDINEKVFDVDNYLLKTFVHLFKQPEAVINEFIAGTRKKYVNVIQYFALSLTLAGIQLYLQNAFFSDVIATDTAFLGELQNYENQENNPFKDTNLEDFNNYQNLFYIISVPISAIATWAAFFIAGKRGFNFTEHIVLNLYYSAQIIIINSVITIALLSFGIN